MSILPYPLDDLFRSVGVGSLDRALANNIYGINHMQNPGMVKANKDLQGYTFMTRPQLNLQKDNIRNYRELYPLLNEDPNSLAKGIRMILDPRLGAGYRYKTLNGWGEVPPIYSNVVDNNNAFIPMVTNNLVSISGWPDETMTTRSTDPGLHKQVFVTADGIARHYGEYDLSINLQNVAGDPMSILLHTWLHYMGAIKEKKMYPYHDHILGDRLDYASRVYRVVLNEYKTHVTKIFACIGGFPTSNPTGMFADSNRETPFSEQTKEISFRFKCMGFVAYDPLLIIHFNRTVEMFNSSMKQEYRDTDMVLLSQRNLRQFNHRAYPRIDPDTMEMQWWVPKYLVEEPEPFEDENPLSMLF